VTLPTKETKTLPQTNKDAKDSEEPADMEIDDTTLVEKIKTETKLEKSNNEGHLEEEAATDVVNEEKEKLDSTDDKEGVKEGEEEENQPASGPPMDTEVEKEEQKPDEKGEVQPPHYIHPFNLEIRRWNCTFSIRRIVYYHDSYKHFLRTLKHHRGLIPLLFKTILVSFGK
jgi:hypothetical protein